MSIVRLKIQGIIEYDKDIMHDDSEEETSWFFGEVLMKGLFVYSDELGDDVGILRITSISKEV